MTHETPSMQMALCTPLHTFRVGTIRFCIVNSCYLDTLCSMYILNIFFFMQLLKTYMRQSRITEMHATRQWIGHPTILVDNPTNGNNYPTKRRSNPTIECTIPLCTSTIPLPLISSSPLFWMHLPPNNLFISLQVKYAVRNLYMWYDKADRVFKVAPNQPKPTGSKTAQATLYIESKVVTKIDVVYGS